MREENHVPMAKYKVTQSAVTQLLEDVRREQIAIPELQRPFVWTSSKVRDLMDSLYKGYPVGYLITWQSIGAKLKGGQVAAHQQILIDGQQRITALRAAVAGLKVVDNRYREVRIVVAFNPITEEFATLTPVIRNDPKWISDVSDLFTADSTYGFIQSYLAANPEADQDLVVANIGRLESIRNAQIGIISLNDDLDVETVSEIFIRINSKGVPLSSADFAMSKIATYGERGRNLRKLIDYFSHLSVAPHAFDDIEENDREFVESGFLREIAWLKHDSEDLYDPSYGDLVRVAGLVGFGRGRASSIVGLLSGRDPETRKFDENRIPLAFDALEEALLKIVKKYSFQNFLMTIKSAGFVVPSMVGSKNALNFAYALYLRMRDDPSMSEGERKRILKRWFVMSLLTERNSGSFESVWERDMRQIADSGAVTYLEEIEAAELGEDFWKEALPRKLRTIAIRSPFFQTFVAAQVSQGSRGFLSKSITVRSLQELRGDIHHIVPKDYLMKHGVTDRVLYNQVANYVWTETPVNIAISNSAPRDYMARIRTQQETGTLQLGELTVPEDVAANLRENAVPQNLAEVSAETYLDFLEDRRKLMAERIRNYYEQL